MKIVFKDIGHKKFSKIIEIQNIIGYEDIKDFCSMEIAPHLPDATTEFELIPTDGLPDLMSKRYVVVHYDSRLVSRGMGTVLIYD